MKKIFNKSNIITLLIVAYVGYLKAPEIIKNFQTEGKQLKTLQYSVISPEGLTAIDFPPPNSRAIAIFWASWCGPCKVEMNRLKTSVETGEIPKDGIFAINPFEDRATIESFLKQNNYPFIFIENQGLAEELKVNVTPTTAFINQAKVTSLGSGMSLLGIWRAEFFLSE